MCRCYLSANYTGTGQSECEEGTRVHQIYCEESKATNGPQVTVSQKTQNSVELPLNGVDSLIRNTTTVNSEYKDNIDWQTLLTTQVENLHAVSHFKHETFNALPKYATDLAPYQRE